MMNTKEMSSVEMIKDKIMNVVPWPNERKVESKNKEIQLLLETNFTKKNVDRK